MSCSSSHHAESNTTDQMRAAQKTSHTPTKADVNIDSLMNKMSLREKIGQLFIVRARGKFESRDDKDYRNLVEKIKRFHVGGLIFFHGNIYGQAVLTNKLQKISDIPLWITEDMEWGAAMRVDGTTRFVPSMGVAATQHPGNAYQMGKITAQEAKALGVDQIFAPVVDVNNNPRNPVINVRSFSGNPDTVAAYGKAFIRGAQSEGLLATAKHFPGHGDTGTDSHLSLPVVKNDYARLDSVELVPFRAAVNQGVHSVMTAHIAFPAVSANKDLPATLDPSILHRILRDSMGFNRLVVTDALEMKGITSHFSPGEAVIKTLQAGADLMLLSPDELTAEHEIVTAVNSGELSEDRIDQSVRKLLHWKKRHQLFDDHRINIDSLSQKIATKNHLLKAQKISQKSLTLLKNDGHILPITSSRFPRLMVVTVADDGSGDTGSSLTAQMRRYHPSVMSHLLDRRTSKEEKKAMLSDAKRADLIIIGSFIYVRTGRDVQLSSKHRRFLKKLISNKPSALIAFGNPYIVQDLPQTDAQLMAWSASKEQIQSVVPALFGGTAISGHLPINIPGMYPLGHGLQLTQTTLRHDVPEMAGLSPDSLQRINHIMNKAVFDSTFPGGVVTVVKDGIIAYQKGFGYETYAKHHAVKSNEIYDLASLTKVLATTPSIMKLVDEHKISLDDPVSKYIPAFAHGKKKLVTIRNLLLHNSGLPAFRVYVDKLKTRKAIIHAVNHEPLIHEPGEKYKYSDLGFIILGEIIRKITGQRLDIFARRSFYYTMGMNSTYFNPKKMGHWISGRIPPAEIDTAYRHKTLTAEVDDERAYYMDGVAGHAGLFSSGSDIAVFAQMLLNGGTYAGKRYLGSSTVKNFTSRKSPQVNRGYGYDRKSKGFSTAGSLTSNQTFGHLGFTGTSFWVDPKRDLAIIILTNRTYPHRSYGKNINNLRAHVADAVVSSITDKK